MKVEFLSKSIGFLLLFTSSVVFAQKATYKVDVSKSSIAWEGKKLTGSHQGTINFSKGQLLFDGKKLIGGTFTANMTSLKEAENNERLTAHLKNDDFFGVDKFPEADFVIRKIAGSGNQFTVTGDMTIKGKTNSLSFPVNVSWGADKSVTATAENVVIDRTKYGIEYKSKSVFSTLGNNFINDDFAITVRMVGIK